MKRSSTIRFRGKPCRRAGSILLEVSVSAFVLAIAACGAAFCASLPQATSQVTQAIRTLSCALAALGLLPFLPE